MFCQNTYDQIWNADNRLGLNHSESTIYVMERHDQLLQLWREKNLTNIRLVHLDFHCDLRGMLIDRSRQCAYVLKDVDRGLDDGNFITYAIKEDRIKRVRWFHDIPGGRRYDVGTVKYESDLSVRLSRMWNVQKSGHGIPLDYEVRTFSQWTGLEEGEFLDIDWDVFACTEYKPETIESRIEAFFDLEFAIIPRETAICYSPGYSHPSRPQFENFIERLADRFCARIVRLPQPQFDFDHQSLYKKVLPEPIYSTLRAAFHQGNRWLRHHDIY